MNPTRSLADHVSARHALIEPVVFPLDAQTRRLQTLGRIRMWLLCNSNWFISQKGFAGTGPGRTCGGRVIFLHYLLSLPSFTLLLSIGQRACMDDEDRVFRIKDEDNLQPSSAASAPYYSPLFVFSRLWIGTPCPAHNRLGLFRETPCSAICSIFHEFHRNSKATLAMVFYYICKSKSSQTTSLSHCRSKCRPEIPKSRRPRPG